MLVLTLHCVFKVKDLLKAFQEKVKCSILKEHPDVRRYQNVYTLLRAYLFSFLAFDV